MKVVLLAPGKSSHTHKWAMFYKEQGIDVTVVTFKDHFSEQNAQEIPTKVLPKHLPGKLSYLTSVFSLRSILKELKPDIVHAHFASSYGLVGAMAGFHPYFVSVWGTDIFQFPNKSKLNRRMIVYTLRNADVVCSTSHIMAEETKKYVDKPIEVTPFGVNLNLFYPELHPVRPQYKIGIAKGLEDKYGFRDLFQVFADLRNNLPNTQLVIIGSGPMEQEYRELCRALGIQEAVTFTGQVVNTKIPSLVRDLDLVVLPSYEDSFGVTAIEAMACAIPVVAYDAGGLKEVILDGESGVLVSMGNKDELRHAIEQLLLDDKHRTEMGKHGVEHVRRSYDWQENASRMVKLYQRF
jgi:glycosyltransferase involved in cell wall biosynthesis